MTPEKTEKLRSLAGRLLCHSLDGPRVQFESGLVMQGMSTPRLQDEARMHRAVRYIAEHLVWIGCFVGRVVLRH